MTTKFKRAKAIKIYNENCEEIEEYKAVVNETDMKQVFSIVGNGYKIAQHDEVLEIITKAIDDLQVKHTVSTVEMGSKGKEGARLRINLSFPEIYHSIAGEKITLFGTFDNSYDLSTGLKLEVNAMLERTETNLFCSEFISTELNKFYHRHTKGLEVEILEGTISKGIELFQDRIGKEFQDLADSPMSTLEARDFISNLIENKSVKVAKKYMEMIVDALAGTDKINTAWGLYSLVSSILTKEVASVDLRKNNSRELLGRIQKSFVNRK